MMTGPRGRGRKASGYVPVKTIEQVRQMMIDDVLRPDRGVPRGQEKI